MKYDGDEWEIERIRDMHVKCSLMLRNFDRGGVAMSDCCQAPASFGVLHPNGAIYFRCTKHADVIRIHPEWEGGVVMSKIWRRVKS